MATSHKLIQHSSFAAVKGYTQWRGVQQKGEHAMDSQETEAFAHRLMREVWQTFDINAVSRFCHANVVGHHRAQTLNFGDVLNRLAWDHKHSADPIFDIQNLVAAADQFAIRFPIHRH